ncbi:MAG TPA: F0F1 ATP synthase subunit delta [Sandaracinaceae bacterium LLY-WYZ-13_1]|nr:F0F1 ATP synthase subunit delta [Sandaracinaceae bacterium LLY-WYZ-13_1]
MELDPTTLLFETINFVVLVFLLWRIVYRPLRRSIQKRQAAVREDLEKAEAARAEAERREGEWAAREKELAALREEVRAEAVEAAEKERARILERAREDASAELARVRQLQETEREAVEQWVRAAVWDRGTELAGRMLQALAPARVDEVLGERLVEVLERHADEVREELEESEGAEIEVSGATMPDPTLVSRLREVLARAVGHPPRLSTHEDESLVAGWTVRVGDRLFDASVAGQLAAFRELAREMEREPAHG